VYTASIIFSNHASGRTLLRTFTLSVAWRDYFVESWWGEDFDLAYTTLMFAPDGSQNFYSACREPVTSYLSDPSGGSELGSGTEFGVAAEVNLPAGRDRVVLWQKLHHVLCRPRLREFR